MLVSPRFLDFLRRAGDQAARPRRHEREPRILPHFTKRGSGRKPRFGSGQAVRDGAGLTVVNGRIEVAPDRPRLSGTKGLRP